MFTLGVWHGCWVVPQAISPDAAPPAPPLFPPYIGLRLCRLELTRQASKPPSRGGQVILPYGSCAKREKTYTVVTDNRLRQTEAASTSGRTLPTSRRAGALEINFFPGLPALQERARKGSRSIYITHISREVLVHTV
jgi:hypothetical protein